MSDINNSQNKKNNLFHHADVFSANYDPSQQINYLVSDYSELMRIKKEAGLLRWMIWFAVLLAAVALVCVFLFTPFSVSSTGSVTSDPLPLSIHSPVEKIVVKTYYSAGESVEPGDLLVVSEALGSTSGDAMENTKKSLSNELKVEAERLKMYDTRYRELIESSAKIAALNEKYQNNNSERSKAVDKQISLLKKQIDIVDSRANVELSLKEQIEVNNPYWNAFSEKLLIDLDRYMRLESNVEIDEGISNKLSELSESVLETRRSIIRLKREASNLDVINTRSPTSGTLTYVAPPNSVISKSDLVAKITQNGAEHYVLLNVPQRIATMLGVGDRATVTVRKKNKIEILPSEIEAIDAHPTKQGHRILRIYSSELEAAVASGSVIIDDFVKVNIPYWARWSMN